MEKGENDNRVYSFIWHPRVVIEIAHHRTYKQRPCLFITDQTPHMGILSGNRPQKALLLNDHF